MSTSSSRRLRLLLALLLPSGLLGGCHSAQPAFPFRPATPATVVAISPTPTVDSAAAPAPTVAVAAPQPRLAADRARSHRVVIAAAPAARSRRSRSDLHRQLLRPRPVARHHAARRPADDGRRPRDTFHIVLGAVLIVGSVLVGLWLGGWLGLGVGAAIMLLGDYFLVLGIGGKHAWLEIFQEFFNM